MAVDVKVGKTFESGIHIPLVHKFIERTWRGNSYAVASDGQRFLINTLVEAINHLLNIV
jgi:hypothetical protein